MNKRSEQNEAQLHDLQLERIDRAAADWFVKRGDAGANDNDEEFLRWLSSDTRHGHAYDEIAATFEDIGTIESLHDLKYQNSGRSYSRFLKVFGGLAVASVAAWFVVVPGSSGPTETYFTKAGEIREVALSDGSTLILSPQSRIVASLSEDERSVTLEQGSVFFAVAHDRSRPFHVEAGGAAVRVVGTKFEIRKNHGQTSVAVEQGRVEVKDRFAIAFSTPSSLLQAGQSSVVRSQQRYVTLQANAPSVARVDPREVALWRTGHLVYNDMALADVVADLNRYYAPGVSLADETVGNLRVTASFKTSDIPQFLSAMSGSLPVSVNGKPGRSFSIDSRR